MLANTPDQWVILLYDEKFYIIVAKLPPRSNVAADLKSWPRFSPGNFPIWKLSVVGP
jgi:hypothetical protein